MLEIILKYGDIHSVISTLSRPIFYKKIFDLEYVNFNNHFEIQVKPIIDIIKSLNNQTFQDFELLIMDDGSTDDTEDIVNSFNDSRIIYLWKVDS